MSRLGAFLVAALTLMSSPLRAQEAPVWREVRSIQKMVAMVQAGQLTDPAQAVQLTQGASAEAWDLAIEIMDPRTLVDADSALLWGKFFYTHGTWFLMSKRHRPAIVRGLLAHLVDEDLPIAWNLAALVRDHTLADEVFWTPQCQARWHNELFFRLSRESQVRALTGLKDKGCDREIKSTLSSFAGIDREAAASLARDLDVAIEGLYPQLVEPTLGDRESLVQFLRALDSLPEQRGSAFPVIIDLLFEYADRKLVSDLAEQHPWLLKHTLSVAGVALSDLRVSLVSTGDLPPDLLKTYANQVDYSVLTSPHVGYKPHRQDIPISFVEKLWRVALWMGHRPLPGTPLGDHLGWAFWASLGRTPTSAELAKTLSSPISSFAQDNALTYLLEGTHRLEIKPILRKAFESLPEPATLVRLVVLRLESGDTGGKNPRTIDARRLVDTAWALLEFSELHPEVPRYDLERTLLYLKQLGPIAGGLDSAYELYSAGQKLTRF